MAQPDRKAKPQFSQPVRQISLMLIVLALTGVGAFHFVRGRGATTVPYAGGSLGANVSSGGGLALGLEGGVKQFIVPGGAITASAFISTTGDFNPFTIGVQGGVSIFI